MLLQSLAILSAVAATASAQAICQDEASCRVAASLLSDGSSFKVVATQTKGCFQKGGTIYWSPGGTAEENGMPGRGQQTRIYCDALSGDDEGDSTTTTAATTTVAQSTEGDVSAATSTCLTAESCEARAAELSLNWGGPGPTAGCFSKGDSVYFGSGGTEEQMGKADLPGVQVRVYCPAPAEDEGGSTTESTQAAVEEEPEQEVEKAVPFSLAPTPAPPVKETAPSAANGRLSGFWAKCLLTSGSMWLSFRLS